MAKFYTNVQCQGNFIYYRGVENGRRIHQKLEYKPTLFVPSNAPEVEGRDYWRDLKGNVLEPVDFPSISEAREFIKRYEDVKSFEIHGNSQFEYTMIADLHPEEHIEWDIEQIVTAFIDIEVDTKHNMPDSETCLNAITAITVKFSNDPKYYVLGCRPYTPHRPDIEWHQCDDEEDLLERFLTLWTDKNPDIVTGWNVKTFDIPYLVGRLCVLEAFGEKRARWLSPWGRIQAKEETFYNKPQRVYKLLGLSILDYMQLFRKYAKNAAQESYKLDHIAHVELKERKVDYSEYESLHGLYDKNHQKFIEYNIKDVELVERLNAKGRLIEMALTLSYDNRHNYEDVFGQIRMWDTICYNFLRRKGIVIPPKSHNTKDVAYEGAYVKDPHIGVHKWIVSLDLNSLYPHLMMQYNMSPETIIEPENYTVGQKAIIAEGVNVTKLLSKSMDLSGLGTATMTPNGQFFTKGVLGFLPAIMLDMYNGRVIYKKKQIEAEKEKEACTDPVRKKELESIISRYKNLQLAKKVSLNSAYGALGSEFFRFYDVRIAEGVTLAGQLSIRWIEDRINLFMNSLMKTTYTDYVVASDTDSIYLNLAPLVNKVFKDTSDTNKVINFMDTVCQEKLQPFIDANYQDLADYMQAYAQKMQMKREALIDKAIWTAKKCYMVNVWDQEGVRYREADMVIHGLQAIKSSTPGACRLKIKEALKIIMNGTEDQVIDFITKFREEFPKLPVADIAFPRGVNGLDKYTNKTGLAERQHPVFCGFANPDESYLGSSVYTVGTPIHVKGALLYNHYLKSMNLNNQYESIREGEKIKFAYLKPGNIFDDTVVSFIGRYPKEFQLEKFVDYDLMFEKAFLEPLNIVLLAIGWKHERTSSLEGFFA